MGATISSDLAQGAQSNLVRERERRKKGGFATLRKKLISRRRRSSKHDHGRVLREFVSNWSPVELFSLLEEYEALSALKDLSMQAELARPPATTFKQDLSTLYDCKLCTDCDLVFRGNIFPVHRALLSARCPYFRDLLAGCPGYGARIMLELRSSPVDVQMFSSLLRYLYTGDLCPHDPTIDVSVLRRLGEDFGTPNPLEHDLRYLLETGDYADATLVFTSESSNNINNSNSSGGGSGECQRPDSGSSEYGFRPKLELPCHKAILSARSPFFRGMIQRRLRSFEEQGDRAIPTRIVLDETVIPKRYARVLLHAIYLDTVDLSLVIRTTNSSANAAPLGSLSEAQIASSVSGSGRQRSNPLEEAMELYQIGRFLELDILSQGCEDLILEWLTLESLPMVLKWGSQPHGSSWVYRQACHYLREEFSAIAVSPILHQLEKTQLIDALQSNFLQASELEVLGAVLKWGEQELIRRMEDREPNLLSHTAHSVTRKGIKKRDLSDIELREILSELLPHVRMDHVLPPNNETLHSAIRRGLVSTPPSHMIGDDRENLRINAWIRGGKNHGLFVRPRLFMSYYDEVKSLLEDHNSSQQIEIHRMRRARHYPDIPDTLYMVSRLNRCSVGNVSSSSSNDLLTTPATQLDVITSTSTSSIPAPDPSSMGSMQKREQKLRQTPTCQRALSLTLSSKHEIYRQIRLRVVREFNFPDEVSTLLENSVSCFCNDDLMMNKIDDDSAADEDIITGPSSPMASNENIPEALSSNQYGNNLTFPRGGVQGAGGSSQHSNSGSYRRLDLPSLVTEGENYLGGDEGGADGGHISMIMPDVTASLGQMQIGGGGSGGGTVSSCSQLNENIDGLHLDLGDGSSHIISNQPSRSAQSMHLYGAHSAFLGPNQRLSSSSVGNYHHYMTRSNIAAGGSNQGFPTNNLSSQQQQQQISSSSIIAQQPSTSQMHHLASTNQVPSNSPFVVNRPINNTINFRTSSSSSHSHSSSFL
ncbi:CLUMA_CG019051, isoform A [Clunio marinus]|uniref:CLUMA_CG019051, isoform A n=1 Tax=Clunio marinus TaxID=568069 RepID=A0A1J1J5Z0_9DIPT|nr:CLUMA_CG019051, isoform A [Clunio marinus]